MPTTTPSTPAVEDIRDKLERQIRGSRLNLPVMPEVALRVKAAAADPASSAGTLARIIELDPSLAARLLKMTNSALYAGLYEIRDLAHAIGRLGTAMVVAVVLGAAGKKMFRSDDGALVQLLDTAWKRSLHASVLARRLAPLADESPEEGFLAGLLHAAGEPILIDAVASLTKSGEIDHPSSDEIRAAIEPIAPEAGATLLERWGIPESIVVSVRHHRRHEEAPEELRAAVTVVALSAALGDLAARDDRSAEAVSALVSRFAGSCIDVSEASVRDWLDLALEDGRELSIVF